jgi:acyl dehydratase
MPIDPAVAIGAELPEQSFTWSAGDVLLYPLALGAAPDPTDPGELRLTTEDDLRVLPTFALVAPVFNMFEPPAVRLPGIHLDLASVLFGGQDLVAHRPLPTEGRVTLRARVADVYDKGSAAVVVHECEGVDDGGEPLFTTRSSLFARGAGGFGGERGPSPRVAVPTREPDLDVTTPTLPQQALLYRLCGDRNPLHSDPGFSAAAGFDRPILHGLCSYGMVCKTLVDHVLDGDPTQVAGFSARFTAVVYPGETLRTRAWRRERDWVVETTVTERDDAPVITDSVFAARG